jgi:hypothetical protein
VCALSGFGNTTGQGTALAVHKANRRNRATSTTEGSRSLPVAHRPALANRTARRTARDRSQQTESMAPRKTKVPTQTPKRSCITKPIGGFGICVVEIRIGTFSFTVLLCGCNQSLKIVDLSIISLPLLRTMFGTFCCC